MSRTDAFERIVRDWFASEGGHAPPRRLEDAVIQATAERRPRPGWLVAARGDAYATGTAGRVAWPVGRAALVLLLAALLAVIVGGLAITGGVPKLRGELPTNPPSLPAVVAVESPSATALPSSGPSASASASLAPSVPENPTGAWTAAPDALAYVQGPMDPLSGGPGTLLIAGHDGSNPHEVAANVDRLAGWSASAKYLALIRGNGEAESWTVTVIEPDGTVVGTIDVGGLNDVSWSPTDDLLLASSLVRDKAPLPHPRFALHRADGTLVRTLTGPPGVSVAVNGTSWSPDGRSLLIGGCAGCRGNRDDDTPDLGQDLWILRTTDSAATKITDSPSLWEAGQRWSPDGNWVSYWIACRVSQQGCPGGTWLVSPDGSGRRQVMPNQAELVWSPDGKRIAFSQAAPGSSPSAGPANGSMAYRDVYVADPDGSHLRPLTTTGSDTAPLAWSPDGRQILFYVAHQDPADPTATLPRQMWLMNADGSGQVRLGSQWNSPAWRPTP